MANLDDLLTQITFTIDDSNKSKVIFHVKDISEKNNLQFQIAEITKNPTIIISTFTEEENQLIIKYITSQLYSSNTYLD